MSVEVLQQTSHALILSDEERDSLLGLLRRALGEARVEMHRTHTPTFRDLVLCEENVIRVLIEKLEQIGPVRPEVSPGFAMGMPEEAPAADVLYIDEQGRFQMSTEDLDDFIGFLRDHDVRVEVETADVFRSGGRSYGYGRLLHLFDADSVNELYQTWRQSRA